MYNLDQNHRKYCAFEYIQGHAPFSIGNSLTNRNHKRLPARPRKEKYANLTSQSGKLEERLAGLSKPILNRLLGIGESFAHPWVTAAVMMPHALQGRASTGAVSSSNP